MLFLEYATSCRFLLPGFFARPASFAPAALVSWTYTRAYRSWIFWDKDYISSVTYYRPSHVLSRDRIACERKKKDPRGGVEEKEEEEEEGDKRDFNEEREREE